MSTLPMFPTDSLPDTLATWVEAEASATQTPPDLAGLLTLSVCAARLARKVCVSPRDGWIEPTNIFTAILLEPGNRKSAVFADATKPLREIEAELIESSRGDVARAATRRRQTEARLKKLERKIAESSKDDDEARHEADVLAEQLDREPVPVLPRLIADDATDEKLASMLASQGGRMASMSPEGGVFDIMAGKYSAKGEAFNTFLKSHAGDDIVVDRMGRESVAVARPALTCAYAIQPQVIRGISGNPAFRGRGLLGRFLYAAPESMIGMREIAPDPVPGFVHKHYRNLIRSLGEIGQACVLTLDSLAVAVFRDWEAEVEYMLRDGGQMMLIRDWGAKLCGATLRLAGAMHCCEHATEEPISRETIRSAIAISKYLIPHAAYVLAEMSAADPGADKERADLVGWLMAHGGEGTVRDVSRGLRRFRGKAVEAEHALNDLAEAGLGAWEIVPTATNVRRVFRLKQVATVTDSVKTAEIRESVAVASVATPNYESNGYDPDAVNRMFDEVEADTWADDGPSEPEQCDHCGLWFARTFIDCGMGSICSHCIAAGRNTDSLGGRVSTAYQGDSGEPVDPPAWEESA